MKQKIREIKKDFVAEAKSIGLANEVEAIFNIGSASGKDAVVKTDYQDFDIHFLFPEISISDIQLEKIRKVFSLIKDKYTDSDTAVDFAVRDLPWKMIPQKKENIGLHGSVLNKLDFIRRSNLNPVLARNMWDNSEVLFGKLNYLKKDLERKDIASGPGGTGWLKENFYRFLAIADVNNPNILPVIPEVCYYFGTSPLLHHYYLNNGKTTSRSKAYDFFMNSDESSDLKKMVEFIRNSQHSTFSKKSDYEELLNQTIKVVNHFHSLFAGTKLLTSENEEREEDLISTQISSELGRVLKRDINFKEYHLLIEDGDYAHLRQRMNEKIKDLKNPRTYSFFDAIEEIVNGTDIISLVYFWTPDNLERRNSLDFKVNDTSKLFAWERGLTTIIQRLHERRIAGQDNLAITKSFSKIFTSKYSESYQENMTNLYNTASELLNKINLAN